MLPRPFRTQVPSTTHGKRMSSNPREGLAHAHRKVTHDRTDEYVQAKSIVRVISQWVRLSGEDLLNEEGRFETTLLSNVWKSLVGRTKRKHVVGIGAL